MAPIVNLFGKETESREFTMYEPRETGKSYAGAIIAIWITGMALLVAFGG